MTRPLSVSPCVMANQTCTPRPHRHANEPYSMLFALIARGSFDSFFGFSRRGGFGLQGLVEIDRIEDSKGGLPRGQAVGGSRERITGQPPPNSGPQPRAAP